LTVEQNLFRTLSPGCRRSFEAGDGVELGKNGARGKMQAVHSSSVLACNFFDYWVDGDASLLGRTLGISGELCGIWFEQKFPTGLRGNAPNLDVVVGTAGAGLAIESKFMEPYQPSPSKCIFRDAYFAGGKRLWLDKGLARCQELAEEIHRGALQYRMLDATQLLKHMLGLACADRRFSLMCLWYRVPGPAGDMHARELEHFANRIADDEQQFRALTYQELFAQLSADGTQRGHTMYLNYLRERYFHWGAR
jgi:hypothetical protein